MCVLSHFTIILLLNKMTDRFYFDSSTVGSFFHFEADHSWTIEELEKR